MPIFTTLAAGAARALRAIGIMAMPFCEAIYDTPGMYLWTCPEGVTSVCVVAVGGGGGGQVATSNSCGGGGGGLGWKNNIPVTPNQQYTVVVGAGGERDLNTSTTSANTDGEASYFIDTSTVSGGGGKKGINTGLGYALGGTFVGDGGGNGGRGYPHASYAGGGGGAGGYTGNGGNGSASGAGSDGSGGGGGGGSAGGTADTSGAGGGVGLFGIGSNGIGGASSTSDGKGGTGGSWGDDATSGTFSTSFPSRAGKYGGGGASSDYTTAIEYTNGASGAVRIIWGEGRAFPSTLTGPYIFKPSIYVSSGSNSVVERYDLETAELLGSITFPNFGDISEAISYKDFIVIMGTGYMSFYNKYTMIRGNVIANTDFIQALCTDGDYIYAQLNNGYIRKYTISSTGLDLSLVATSASMITNSAQDASQIYYDNGYIYGADYNHHAWKVNASTLTREWINTTLGSGYARGCCKAGDYVYVNTDSNTMVKLNDSNGALVDTLTLPATDAREIVTDGDYLYTSCSNGALVKIRLSDFTIVDSVTIGSGASVAIALHEGVLYVATASSGIISTVDPETMDVINASAYDSNYSGSVRAIVVDNCIDFRSA